MRVAIIGDPYVPVPPKKYGGTEQVIAYLIRGLQEIGHEPIFVGPADSTIDCELVPTIKRSLSFAKNTAQLWRDKQFLAATQKRTARIVRTLADRVDIIHSHGFDLKQFQHIPNLTTLHGPFTFDNLKYYRERAKMPFVSISHNQRAPLPDLNYIATIYNGEDPHDFTFVAKPKPYVCFIGRLDRDKNPDLAIRLAQQMKLPIKLAGKLDIYGKAYYNQILRPLLKLPRVTYLGELDFSAKVKLMGNAQCNLHPTGFREPFGLTVIEAGMCGTPTLAIQRGAIPEIIEQGRTGFYVEDFIEGVVQLQNCLALDRSQVAAYVGERFSYQVMAKKYVTAYKKVIRSFG